MPSIYLVNPRCDFPTYYGAEVFEECGFKPATMVADLAVATAAALVPPDFDVTLCEENVTPIDFDTPAELVGITGKVSQWGRMQAIAAEFRRRGKTVIVGGPFASLSPDVVRPHCDVLVRGEAENIAERLYADLRAGKARDEYVGDQPELTRSPIPRWDLYPNERATMGTVQTSRGCPFQCEFCDVIQYVGRKQRHKPPAHVIRELDVLYALGYRSVFLCDDNFTVYRARARELLLALRDWNATRRHGRVRFLTQVSIDAAREPDLLRLCAEAGLTRVFIGIETPNEESLKETHKKQNMGRDLVNEVHAFFDAGIAVVGGMIVGFDADTPDIFDRQYEFAMASAIPIFSIGTLIAPPSTPLHERLRREGRLMQDLDLDSQGTPWSTNIIPRGMTSAQLIDGMRSLCNRLYDPAAFGDRVLRFIERTVKSVPAGRLAPPPSRPVERDGLALVSGLISLGKAEAKMFTSIYRAINRAPEIAPYVVPMLLQYRQIRHLYDKGRFWEPRLAA